jgi:hypothetical protein
MATKDQFLPDTNEFETREQAFEKNARVTRMAESLRLALMALALLAGLTIVGTSADTLAVYNKTHVGSDFLLPLSGVWPSEFDLRPTIALVTCGSIITVTSAIALIANRVSSVWHHAPLSGLLDAYGHTQIRYNPLIHRSVSCIASTICLIAGLIGTSFYYGINRSNTVFSLQAWTCQWSNVPMTQSPHWGALCKESKTALYLTVMIIPLEVLVLGFSAYVSSAEKKQLVIRERKGSPAMSWEVHAKTVTWEIYMMGHGKGVPELVLF